MFMVPLALSFEVNTSETLLIDFLIDICFVADMIIVFRTSFINQEGEEVVSALEIAKNYMKGRFTFDFLSVVPFDKLFAIFTKETSAAKQLQIFGILKLIRILRLNKIIMYMNVKKDTKASIRVIKLMFFLLMYVHSVACFWHGIVTADNVWIPPVRYKFGWEGQGEFYEQPKFYRYLVCAYYSCIFLFGTES